MQVYRRFELLREEDPGLAIILRDQARSEPGGAESVSTAVGVKADLRRERYLLGSLLPSWGRGEREREGFHLPVETSSDHKDRRSA